MLSFQVADSEDMVDMAAAVDSDLIEEVAMEDMALGAKLNPAF